MCCIPGPAASRLKAFPASGNPFRMFCVAGHSQERRFAKNKADTMGSPSPRA